MSTWAGTFAKKFGNSGFSFGDDAMQQGRQSLLDNLACYYLGRQADQYKTLLVSKVACDPDSHPGSRALLAGTASHAMDFDDQEMAGSTHPSSVLVSTLLGLNGRQPLDIIRFCRAYLTGYEMTTLLGGRLTYSHYQLGWHSTATIGPVSAAAACAAFLALDTAKFSAAITIASSYAAGLQRQFGSSIKAYHAGLAARAGVEAALLAKSGFSAGESLFEARHGYFEVYSDSQDDTVTQASGDATRENPICRKRWPTCGYTHRAIAAALEFHHVLKSTAETIDTVEIEIAAPYLRIIDNRKPRNDAEARFSLLYCVASALSRGAVSPAHFSESAILDPGIRALMERIRVNSYETPPELADIDPGAPETLRLKTVSGTLLLRKAANLPGGPVDPVSMQQTREKFIESGGDSSLEHAITHHDTITHDLLTSRLPR